MRVPRTTGAITGSAVATAMLVARLGAGATMALVPGPVSRTWLGSSSSSARALIRLVGLRDVLLVVGQVCGGPASRRRWLQLAAAADAADATLSLGRAAARRRPLSAAFAVPAVAAAIWAARAART
jgi:hypothetical protein